MCRLVCNEALRPYCALYRCRWRSHVTRDWPEFLNRRSPPPCTCDGYKSSLVMSLSFKQGFEFLKIRVRVRPWVTNGLPGTVSMALFPLLTELNKCGVIVTKKIVIHLLFEWVIRQQTSPSLLYIFIKRSKSFYLGILNIKND